MIVVGDTSPLNYLIRLSVADVLPQLYREILIPDEVFKELRNPKAPDIVRSWATQLPAWIKVQSPTIFLTAELAGLDRGERAAIELACETSATILLIDERKARRVAESLFGFQVFGTLGVLQAAHRAKLIDGAAELEKLSSLTNFHLSEEIRTAYLASLTK